MILPTIPRVKPVGTTVLARTPLEYTPRGTTTLNYERLRLSDPGLKDMRLRFISTTTRFEDGVFLGRLPWIFVLCAAQLVAAATITLASGPSVAAALFCLFPLAVAGLLTAIRAPADQWWAAGGRGLLIAAFAFGISWDGAAPGPLPRQWALYASTLGLILVGSMGAIYRLRFIAAHPNGADISTLLLGWLKDHTWSAKDRVLLWGAGAVCAAAAVAVVPPLARLWSRVLFDSSTALTLAVVLSPIAFAVALHLKKSGWQFLVHDPDAVQAPGMWIGSRLTAPERRALAFVAVLALQAAVIACLLLDANVRASLVQLAKGENATAVSALQAVTLVFVSVVVSLTLLAPFDLLCTIHMRRFKHVCRLGQPPALYNINLQFSLARFKDADGNTIRESDHIFFGYEPFGNFPVLLHRSLIGEHVYICGDAGSGKTSLGLIPLVWTLTGWKKSRVEERPAIVIFDLKGDMALFEAARQSAIRAGKSFRFFTPEQDRSSYLFNPFLNLDPEGQRPPIQMAEVLMDALALNHGEGYGRSFFSRKSRAALLDALNRPGRAESFRDLLIVLERLKEGHPAEYRDAFELISTVKALTSYPQLNTRGAAATPEHTIHMPSVIEEGQVVYFWLPSAVESASVREIGKLALYSLLSAAMARGRARGPNGKALPKRRTYLFIDEFQRIAGENFKVVLEQARSFDVGVILSNQAVSELKTHDADLRSVVRTNTRVKVHFSIQNRTDLMELSDLTGLDAVENHTTGWSAPEGWFAKTDGSQMSSMSYGVKPRLTPSDLLAISDHPHRCVLHVSRGSGLTQFGGRAIPVQTDFMTDAWQYQEDLTAPWPTDETLPRAVMSPVEQDRIAHVATSAERRQVIQALFAEAEETKEVTHDDV